MNPLTDSEVRDVGLILKSLFELSQAVSPEEVFSTYVQVNGKQFRARVETKPIEIKGLPQLVLRRGDLLFVGGAGVVLQCRHHDLPKICYALKSPRPSLFKDPMEALQLYDTFIDEFLKHAPLSHPNMARVFGASRKDIQLEKLMPSGWPSVLMEWVHAPMPLTGHLLNRAMDFRAVLGVVAQCFDALAHLHDADLIHWDIKSDNFLVSGDGTVKTDRYRQRPPPKGFRPLAGSIFDARQPASVLGATACEGRIRLLEHSPHTS